MPREAYCILQGYFSWGGVGDFLCFGFDLVAPPPGPAGARARSSCGSSGRCPGTSRASAGAGPPPPPVPVPGTPRGRVSVCLCAVMSCAPGSWPRGVPRGGGVRPTGAKVGGGAVGPGQVCAPAQIDRSALGEAPHLGTEGAKGRPPWIPRTSPFRGHD